MHLKIRLALGDAFENKYVDSKIHEYKHVLLLYGHINIPKKN